MTTEAEPTKPSLRFIMETKIRTLITAIFSSAGLNSACLRADLIWCDI